MIEKAKAAKSAEELLELAKAEGINITADDAATYFAQLNPQSSELSDNELDNVSGGGCLSDITLYRDYSMVQEFFCTNCFRVYPASRCKVMHFGDILPGMNSEASKPTEHGDCAINRTSHKCGLTLPPAKVDAPTL